ncbi:MAG: hypothetical protein E7248_15360 [Paenibacillaceae bacterium]|nr:hypothetical protein [Paenibacillaceae bacterium]
MSMENENATNQPKKVPFYQSGWFTILLLIFFFPVGLYLMWRYKKFNMVARVIVSALFVFLMIPAIFGKSKDSGVTANSTKTAVATTTSVAKSEVETTTVPESTTVEEITTVADTTTTAETTVAQETQAKVTMGQKNALSKAGTYLSISAFSHSGLIEQLKFEQFSDEEATYAADNCGADWNEEAAKKANTYLSISSFSRDSLIDQLKFDGFTQEQAEYGVTAAGY